MPVVSIPTGAAGAIFALLEADEANYVARQPNCAESLGDSLIPRVQRTFRLFANIPDELGAESRPMSNDVFFALS